VHPAVAVTLVNDEPTLHEMLVVAVLQFAVEQHVYVIPVPLDVVVVGHVNEVAHEYVVLVNTLDT
jgi:hypothetical protein